MSLITPHGGTLVNRILATAAAEVATAEAASLKTIVLSPREQCDLEMIAIGAFSPLTGFMGREDFDSVCKRTCAWPMERSGPFPSRFAYRKRPRNVFGRGEDRPQGR